MKGVSTIIVAVLLLMVSVSLVSFGYVFLTEIMTTTTETGSQAAEKVTSSLLAEMKIESMDESTDTIYVKNSGRVNLTQFNVYVNDALVSASPSPETIAPGEITTISLTSLEPGDVVKVTSSYGMVAIKTVPGTGGPGPPTYVQWGQTTSLFTDITIHTTVRCMGGQAPNIGNMKIVSLHIRFSDSATGAMAVYFGGTENNPSGAAKQAEVLNQAVNSGWNTFTLPSELDWPANQVTWICWKRSGTGGVYYSDSSAESGDFFSSHGRHDDGGGDPTVSFSNSLGAASILSFWYATYLTYYQT
jgi:archaellum component FlaF (FlaF/FlaG flagellin family)